jgi:hypothetical protein
MISTRRIDGGSNITAMFLFPHLDHSPHSMR